MKKNPFRVTLMLWLVLSLTAWNALRAWTSLAWRGVLDEFSSLPSSTVTAVSGMIWMMIGILLAWGLWQRKFWASKLLLGASAGYSVWYWSERLIWQSPHPNWPFAVIVNLVLFGFILFTVKLLLREAYEQKNETPKSE
ncbi:MAG: hypothetical protein NTW69_14920 [Chloroflexi bacterium]|jgi:hypothetical protein|nr:hypothetical protein [Chloroflexota bacterium]